jgi:hypothetical protein
MRSDKYLAMLPTFHYPTLLFNLFVASLESMSTNVLVVFIAAVIIAALYSSAPTSQDIITYNYKISEGFKHLASRIAGLERSQEIFSNALSDALSTVFANAIKSDRNMRKNTKPPAEDPNTAILEAILQRITQLEAQILTPPPPTTSQRLSLSTILSQDTPSTLPTYLVPPLAISAFVSQATTPHISPSVHLKYSPVTAQATAPAEYESPVSSLSPILCQSSAPAEPASPLLSCSTISEQSTAPKSPKLQVLPFKLFPNVSTEPIHAPPLQHLVQSKITAQSTTPVRARSPKLANSKVNAVYTTPLHFSKVVVLDERRPFLVSSESSLVKWYPKDPKGIIMKLIEEKHKLQGKIKVTGDYYAQELLGMQKKFEHVNNKYRIELEQQKTRVVDLETQLENSEISELTSINELDDYEKITSAMEDDGIDVNKYTMLSKQHLDEGKSKLEISIEKSEAKPIVGKVTSPSRTGLNANAFTFEPRSNYPPIVEATAIINKVTSSLGAGLNASASAFTIEPESTSPASEAKPTINKVTTPTWGGLGASKWSNKPPSKSPTFEVEFVLDKIMAPNGGGLGASKYSSEPRLKFPILATTNQTTAKVAVKDKSAAPSTPIPALGDSINMVDWEEEVYCKVCNKPVTLEFEIEPADRTKTKRYIWEPHSMFSHSNCHECKQEVPAMWNSKAGKSDFSEHNKVCHNPANWAECRHCHANVLAPIISTLIGPIHNFSNHNTTCRVKVKMTRVLFYCTNCGEGITNKSDFHDNHYEPCKAMAAKDKTLKAYDYENGKFVGAGNATQTSALPFRTATPHGRSPGFGNQSTPTDHSASATSPTATTCTSPTGPRADHASSSGRRPPVPKFGGRPSASGRPVANASLWQGNVIQYH